MRGVTHQSSERVRCQRTVHIARFPVNLVSLLHLITNKMRANMSPCELHPRGIALQTLLVLPKQI